MVKKERPGDTAPEVTSCQKFDAAVWVVPRRDREQVSIKALAALPLPEVEFPDSMRSRPHTTTLLALWLTAIVVVSIFACPEDPWWQTIYGFVAAGVLFNIYAFCHFQDGILIRPHPGFWRIVKACSILYLMICCLLMFQDVHTVRGYLHWLDNGLHMEPVLKETSDADDCSIYNSELEDPWFAIRSRVDIFVVCHFVGWISKALVMRDWVLLWINSLLFEWMEFSLAFVLINFNECWWDTWIMDVFGCNMFGIIIGLKMVDYFSIKPFNWTRAEENPRGIATAIARQMRPAAIERYEWPKFLQDVRTYILFIGYIVSVILSDLNFFFLKFVLGMPLSHPIWYTRCFLQGFVASAGTRDYYEYMTNPDQARLGQQAWIFIAVLGSEVVLYTKWCFQTPALRDVDPPAPWIIAVNAVLILVVFLGLIVAWRNGKHTAATMAKELKQD